MTEYLKDLTPGVRFVTFVDRPPFRVLVAETFRNVEVHGIPLVKVRVCDELTLERFNMLGETIVVRLAENER